MAIFMPKLTKALSCRKRQRKMTLLFHGRSTLLQGISSADYSLGVTDDIFFCLKRDVKRNQVLSHLYDNPLNTPEIERQTIVFSDKK